MKFKLIVVATAEEMETRIEVLNTLFESGLETLHLRTKALDQSRFREFISRIPSGFHTRTVIHSHYPLLEEFGLQGIHLTEQTKRFTEYAILPKDKLISASFHSLEELARETRPFRYVFLSPVFNSISKPGYPGAFHFLELSTFLSSFREKETQVIALGGVCQDSFSKVRDMGFEGAAVSGAVLQDEDPLSRFREMKRVVDSFH
jgi:thiamine-phosphate pyrophosphorylase